MAKEKTTKKKVNYTKAQLLGLYGLIIGLVLFWGGVYFGYQGALMNQSNEERLKTSAVEEYKATLKASEQ